MEVREGNNSGGFTEDPAIDEHDVEMKVPSAKIRVTSVVSPIGKITIRQSTDSPTKPQTNYEIITQSGRTSQHQESLADLSPTVHLQRYDLSESPKVINNGLDPMGIELISSASLASSKAESEYSDKSDESHVTMKISREMKNLQKSTNDSKILSDYLNTTNESPRSRSRKSKDPPLADPDEEEEYSDSALALPMEPPLNSRISVSRMRNRSRSTVRSRKKSVARIMSEELLPSSDKEEGIDDEEDQLSEVSIVTNRSLDGRAVNPPPKPGWDSFCFKCHTDTAVLSLACSKCKCSYHRHCVRPNPIPKNVEEFECPECRELEAAKNSNLNKYGHEKIDPNTLADMLTIIVEKIRTYPDREHFENDIIVKGAKETQPYIVTQMSLKILESRIKARAYTTTEAFVHDIRQLEHNWNVVDRAKSKTLKSIVKYVNSEINELEACVYCYETSFITGDWFVQPCKRLHLLIWAKLKGYPYWPAKVMSVDSRQHVDVRFFGAHDRAWVPATHCMLFSEQDPNKTKGSAPSNNKNASKNQKGIADAMKEKDDYIENLKIKHGFKYAPFKTLFNPSALQSQLDYMLPGTKDPKNCKEVQNGGEKEIDVAQKEKLTLKIVKGQSSNYQVEQKTAEQRPGRKSTEKDKPKLYKVLSKNDDSADMEQSGRLFPLIIKRKSNVEQETEKAKKMKTNDNASETSESNASVQSGKTASRRKSLRESGKHRRPTKQADTESPEPQAAKKAKHSEKQKAPVEVPVEEPPPKVRRSRAKSTLPVTKKPILVPLVAPPGTDEIQALKGSTSSPPTVSKRLQKRSRSEKSEMEVPKEPELTRRLTISAPQTLNRSASETTRKNSRRESTPKPLATEDKTEEAFDPTLVIKNEPISDNEEAEQGNAYTLSDIPNLIQDKSGKKKLIVISTSDGGETSTSAVEKAKARKTFPNNPNHQQVETVRNGDWMICIPSQVLSNQTSTGQSGSMQSPPTSNRSTPASDTQVSLLRSNLSVHRGTPNAASVLSNHSGSSRSFNGVPPLNYNITNQDQRNSVQSNPPLSNGRFSSVAQSNVAQQRGLQDPPRLIARPQGAFINDGNAFSREDGTVSRLLTDSALRMNDFFRTVIMDTVTMFAPESPEAENLVLRAENEKLQREMQTTKSECQQKMQELRREHQDEIETLKKEFEERHKNLQIQMELERNRIINECEQEKLRAIDMTKKETKRTTWCSNCTKEARFYCCWNTSYCSLQCQRNHWQIHQRFCGNKNSVNEPSPEPLATSSPNATRPAIVIRAPQQLQQSAAMASPPASIHQQIILPYNNTATRTPSNSALTTQPIILNNAYQNKNRAIQAIYQEQVVRESLPTGLIVKTVRHENPNVSTTSTMTVSNSLPAKNRE